MGFWLSRFHSLMVLSGLVVKPKSSYRLKATLLTRTMPGEGAVLASVPMVLSALAEAKVLPLGLKATLLTELLSAR